MAGLKVRFRNTAMAVLDRTVDDEGGSDRILPLEYSSIADSRAKFPR